ncbi:MAG: Ribonuclease HIII [uncultured Rubrobacteraceae bacterium]|uniref:Ribonuclease n=1 Tax=uncultured Rubrobacteraceae bacterium TaxID=349277 RepID=A0A6J4QAT9_9ACTN|nr:MAG: Ribonuclease HIII [uncultured Rubrobacteraceae bacterium]
MNTPPANDIPDSLKRLLAASGAEISLDRPIDHGAQYRVIRGPDVATVNVYTTGKTSTGGRPSPLLNLLEDWRLAQAAGASTGKRERKSVSTAEPNGTPRVGTDEAGKGDYFGPLVVAGVRVLGKKEARELREIGARDSKTLSVPGARDLAQRILESVGAENMRVVILRPREYEARRRAAGDINKLLAEVNVQMFDELGAGVELFVVDEFAKAARSYIGSRLPPGVGLEVRPRAEDDVVVAAASVLARARYLEEMEALSAEAGFELPRGATHVLGAARRVVEEWGEGGLAEVAKVHFGTTRRVLEVQEEKVRERGGRFDRSSQ